jgi:hypothetical protein
MAHDKRFLAQKRQRRRRKKAKAQVKLYVQGKLPFEKLPMLARTMLRRRRRGEAKASAGAK